LFVATETRKTYRELSNRKENVFYNQIQSIHGHDAYLVEFSQLTAILKPILNYHKQQNYVSA
jgi:homoserine O-acetyltransferase